MGCSSGQSLNDIGCVGCTQGRYLKMWFVWLVMRIARLISARRTSAVHSAALDITSPHKKHKEFAFLAVMSMLHILHLPTTKPASKNQLGNYLISTYTCNSCGGTCTSCSNSSSCDICQAGYWLNSQGLKVSVVEWNALSALISLAVVKLERVGLWAIVHILQRAAPKTAAVVKLSNRFVSSQVITM